MKHAVLFISLLLTLTACGNFEAETSSKGVKYISECLHKNMESIEIDNKEGMSLKPPFEFSHQGQDVVVSYNQINGVSLFFSVKVQGKSSQAEADSVLESMFSSITKDCEH